MFFTTALTYKSVCKTHLIIVSGSHDKVKDNIAVFVDFLYNHFDDPGAVHNIIWSDGPSSEFKNKFMLKFLQSLNQKHRSLSHENIFLQAMGKELLMELVAKLRL